MEITTDNATSSKTKDTKITIITITGMEPDFHKAAMQGNINAFQEMGEQIESILTPNKNTILHVHVTNYTDSLSETFVGEVLRMCPSLFSKTNVKGETILHIAARYGHHKIVKKLIDCAKVLPIDSNEDGAKKRLIRAINDKKDTALHEAARYGHIKVVDILIKEEPDHSYLGKNVDDETPLYIAVERKHWNVVDAILDNIDLPQYNGPNGRTALHAAVFHGNKDIVSKLLERNLSAAKEADENGWVPLHLAALCKSSEVVEALVSADRSTAYMRDNKGRIALHFAALQEHSDVMKKIIEYCPDCCELVDEKGSNALHYTAMRKSHHYFELKQIVKDAPLITNLCNEKDDDGNTPLHLLARLAPKWKPFCYYPLLEPQFPRVDIMACNNYGQTVLDVAVADVSPKLAVQNTFLKKLQDIGARLGGRVLDKHLREKEQEERLDSAVDEKEKQREINDLATTLSVVDILIATVTFAAGFTLPGGLIQDGKIHEGSPILKYNAAFIAFVVTDSISFVLSASAVFVIFFSSLQKDEKNFYKSLLHKCAHLTDMAMAFMVIAFGTGIYAALGFSKGFGVVTLLTILSFFLINSLVVSLAKRVNKRPYKPNYSLQRVTDIQLSHTV